MRVASPLPDDLEALIHQTIGCCLDVHRELGPGLLEATYVKALAIELDARGITHDTEKIVPVLYRGQPLHQQRIDLFVDGRLIVEVKSVERLNPIHVAQVISYLKVTGARIGLLVNFNVPLLNQGLRRVIL